MLRDDGVKGVREGDVGDDGDGEVGGGVGGAEALGFFGGADGGDYGVVFREELFEDVALITGELGFSLVCFGGGMRWAVFVS